MLLYKKQIKPVIKSYYLLWVYEQTGMSFGLLANIKPRLSLASCLQTQTFAVGTCIYFSAYQPNPLAQLVNYAAASLCWVAFLKKKKSYFHKGRRVNPKWKLHLAAHLLQNTQDSKTSIEIVGFMITEKLSARSRCTPLLVLHFSERWKSYNHSSF